MLGDFSYFKTVREFIALPITTGICDQSREDRGCVFCINYRLGAQVF